MVAPPPCITADEMVKKLRLLQHPDGISRGRRTRRYPCRAKEQTRPLGRGVLEDARALHRRGSRGPAGVGVSGHGRGDASDALPPTLSAEVKGCKKHTPGIG